VLPLRPAAAGDKAGLLHQLRYILDVVACVPRHRSGDLNYCSECRHDLEDALLVYFLVRGGVPGRKVTSQEGWRPLSATVSTACKQPPCSAALAVGGSANSVSIQQV
jgi:hypothetical protein